MVTGGVLKVNTRELVDANSAVEPLIQAHGGVLVFDRPGLRLIQASETAPRLLGIDLPASFGTTVNALFRGVLGPRVQGLPEAAEERRVVSLPGGPFDARFIASADCVAVELEPLDAATDVTSLGATLDIAALALSDAASMPDVGRTTCAKLAEVTGFGLVALARLQPGGGGEIVGELHDDTLPSLYGRSEALAQLIHLAPSGGIAFIADTGAPPARLLTSPDCRSKRAARLGLELGVPPTAALARLKTEGVAAVAVIPAYVDDRIWGYLIAEHAEPARFGHHGRRFGLELGRLAAAAAERVTRNVKRRARKLAPEAVATFETAVDQGTPPLEALLFGDRLLAATVRAEGIAVLCHDECTTIGRAPDADALLARLPALLEGATTTLETTRLADLGGFTKEELAGTGSALAIRIAEQPFIALAAFQHEAEGTSGVWDHHRVDAFHALAEALRRRLLLSDPAAAAELSGQLAEFEIGAFSAGRLRSAILDSSATGMGLVLGQLTGPLHLVECNRMFRRMFGLDHRELPGGTPKALAQRLGLPVSALTDHGQTAVELELWSADLGPRVVEIDTKSILRTRIGGRSHDLTLVQVTDLTRIRRQEVAMRMARDQALALIRTRDEVLANMSHELRTPLNAVIGFAEMIAEQTLGSVGDPRYAGYGRDIENAGRHLLSLINDVLDLSRLQTTRRLATEETVDLTGLVRSCLDWAQAASRERDLNLTVDGDSDTLTVRCDERAIRQVLINLISNAVKFTPDTGQVTVALKWQAENAVSIEVVDDGIGMSARELARAFEPFFRGGGAYRRRIEGAGLGLSIARGLIELHGGTLTLTSIEGQGTTARIELPTWRIEQPETRLG